MKKADLTDLLLEEEIFSMNGKEREDLKLVIYRLDEQDQKRAKLEDSTNTKLEELHEDIKFIKENLFNPNDGLWAETKQNSRFRQTTTKWGSTLGITTFGLMIKQIYDFFTG